MDNKKFLFKVFTRESHKVQINGEEEKIYDIPLIYALTDEQPLPLQWELDYINIIDEVLDEFDYDIQDVYKFRQQFVQKFLEKEELTHEIQSLSNFLVESAQYKLYSDIQIKKIRPIVFFYINSIEPEFDWKVIKEERPVYDADDSNLDQYEKEFLRKHIEPEVAQAMFDWDRAVDFDTLRKEYLKDIFGNWFDPKWRQRYFLKNQRRFSFIAASRRAGKTTLAAYLIIRQIVLPKQEVVVIVPTLKNHSLPLKNAIKEMLRNYLWKTFKEDESQDVIKNKETGSQVKFYTGSNNNSIRGDAANLLICDEAAFLDEELYYTASASLRTTKWAAYVISTVNPKSPKNWFYYNLIGSEIDSIDENSNKLWMRITLDDNPFIPQEDKEDIKSDSDVNYNHFLAERYCTFLENEDFNLKHFWKVDNDPVEMYVWNMWKVPIHYKAFEWWYKQYLINYDCAQNQDRAAITVWWIHDNWADVIMAEYMDWFWYWDQIQLIKSLKEIFNNCQIAIDYSWPWVVVQQMFERERIYTINVQTVWWNYEWYDMNIYRVWKDVLKGKLQSLMWEKRLSWFTFQKFLRIEFETYDESNNRKNWHHNDMISSLMIWSYVSDRFGLVNLPHEEQEINYKSQEIVDPFWQPIRENAEYQRFKKYWF